MSSERQVITYRRAWGLAMRDGRQEWERVELADGGVISREGTVISTSPGVDPADYIDVREGDTWFAEVLPVRKTLGNAPK